jgi:hypothetical protein
MAVLVSVATGNLTAAATWQVVHAGTFQTLRATQETATLGLNTTFQAGTNFTVAANITVDAVLLKFASKTYNSAVKVTAEIYNSTTATVLATATVDVPNVGNTTPNWIQVKFSSSVVVTTGNNWQIRLKKDTSDSLLFYRKSGTTSDWTFGLRTTTTAAPANGDILLIAPQYTATTYTPFTITNDNTNSALLLGNGTAGTVGLEVSYGCTLQNAVSASTNYYLRVNNDIYFNSGSYFSCGTVASPFPQSSTATFEIYQPADARFSWTCRQVVSAPSTFTCYENQTNKRSQQAELSAQATAGATSFTVTGSPTNWRSGDEIVIPTTARDPNQVEYRTMSANESAGTVQISSGLTYTHSQYHDLWNTKPARVANLTKNIKFKGTSSTLKASGIFWGTYNEVTVYGVEFQYINTVRWNNLFGTDPVGNQVYEYVELNDIVIKECAGGLRTDTNYGTVTEIYRVTGAKPLLAANFTYTTPFITQSFAYNQIQTFCADLFSYGGSGYVGGGLYWGPGEANGNDIVFGAGISTLGGTGIGIYINGITHGNVGNGTCALRMSGGLTLDSIGKFFTFDLDAVVVGTGVNNGPHAVSIEDSNAYNWNWYIYSIRNTQNGILFDASEVPLNHVGAWAQENATYNITFASTGVRWKNVHSDVRVAATTTLSTTNNLRFYSSYKADVILSDCIGNGIVPTASSFILITGGQNTNFKSGTLNINVDCSAVTSIPVLFKKGQQSGQNPDLYLNNEGRLWVKGTDNNSWTYIAGGVYYPDTVNYYQTSPSMAMELTTTMGTVISPTKQFIIPAGKTATVSVWVYMTTVAQSATAKLRIENTDFPMAYSYSWYGSTTTLNSWVKLEGPLYASQDIFQAAAISLEPTIYSVTLQNTGDTITLNNHGLQNGDTVVFTAVSIGFSVYTIYYVVSATTNTFQLSLTSGGSAITFGADGTGKIYILGATIKISDWRVEIS